MFDDNNGWDGMGWRNGGNKERERDTQNWQNKISPGWVERMVLLWLVDQFSTFTEKNSMTSYLQGNRD